MQTTPILKERRYKVIFSFHQNRLNYETKARDGEPERIHAEDVLAGDRRGGGARGYKLESGDTESDQEDT